MARHLAGIAAKEGIQAEEEALQIIAQKADGGLRDALSMFDLIATFSTDRSITYRNTIDNLHILDYDYYFRMTEALLAESIPQAMLIFNEILQKGFDGHQFIVGLGEHFRNLLVCKDPATVTLLQVTGSVQQKYLAQSAQASVSFLLSVLNLGNHCDLNYKTSKSQRLLVELTLMKMAHVPSAVDLGRDWGKNQQNGAAELKKKADAPVNPVENTKSEPPQTPNSDTGNTIAANPAVRQRPAEPAPNNGLPAKTPKLTPTISLNATAAPDAKPNQTAEATVSYGNEPFTPEQLKTHWRNFAATRDSPSEGLILNREFELQQQTVLLRLDNQTQLTQLAEFKHELLEYLRKNLRNSQVQLQADVSVQEKKRMVYTNREKFEYLAEKHPLLNELKTQLGLDVDN